jgi:hypothetical protein
LGPRGGLRRAARWSPRSEARQRHVVRRNALP